MDYADVLTPDFCLLIPLSEPYYSDDAEERARRVELILMDVDGVMTDGRILLIPSQLIPNQQGEPQEVKMFDVGDGVGISFVHRVGLRTGIITGRRSESVTARGGRESSPAAARKASRRAPKS